MPETPPYERPITHRYDDPVDLIWLACAEQLGMTVARSDEAFASYDGSGSLIIATPAALDPDDTLAQMVLHEVCHALVCGDEALTTADWGLDNTDDRDLVYEHACHRVQAALADRHGLRAFMAVTTQWRPYWDALSADPLADGDDPAIALAQQAYQRGRRAPWRDPIDEALEATSHIALACAAAAGPDSLWAAALPPHPLVGRVPIPSDPAVTCATCAWHHIAGPGKPVDRCRQHRPRAGAVAPRVEPGWPGCERWEPPLTATSCGSCAACCREGFHLVPVSSRSPLLRSHPELIVSDSWGLHLPRPHGSCVALDRDDRAPQPSFRCRIYEERPRGCAELEVGGDHCLSARQRVGLSERSPTSARLDGQRD